MGLRGKVRRFEREIDFEGNSYQSEGNKKSRCIKSVSRVQVRVRFCRYSWCVEVGRYHGETGGSVVKGSYGVFGAYWWDLWFDVCSFKWWGTG